MKNLNNLLSHAKPQSRRATFLCDLAPLRDSLILSLPRMIKGCFALIIVSAIIFSPLHAQNIDMEEMTRDINILEGVLEEILDGRWQPQENRVYVTSNDSDNFFTIDRSNEIRGTYLPNYGVIFTNPKAHLHPHYYVFISDTEDENYTYRFQNGEEVTETSIINRIVEFLGKYGPTIDQLSENNKVMVLYNSSKSDNRIFSNSSDEREATNRNKLPTISVIANYEDIQAYRTEDISKNEFRNQLMISTTEANDEELTDLKIMANILETSFNDKDNEEQFQINGDISYLKIDNFGALFSFGISYDNRFGIFFDGLSGNLSKVAIALDNNYYGVNFDNIDSSVTTVTPLDSLTYAITIDTAAISKLNKRMKAIQINTEKMQKQLQKHRQRIEKNRTRRRANMQESLNTFLSQLKETIIDYGSTLDSIAPNQHLLLSIEVNSGFDELPERIILQIEKSILQAVEHGDISEEEAMAEIAVRKLQ